MHLIYFDECKFHNQHHPYFFLGGLLIDEKNAHQLEKTITQIQHNFFGKYTLGSDTELHGSEIFSGKGIYKKRKIQDRIQLFESVLKTITNNNVAMRIIRFNVPKHRSKYTFPKREYKHSLMLFLERCCDYLDQKNSSGLVFGDFEQDEIDDSVLDFSQFKQRGTNYYFGRSLGRLVDTIYFTHSHYSRFMQVADMVCFLCQRYESGRTYSKWHDSQLLNLWTSFKSQIDFKMQDWP